MQDGCYKDVAYSFQLLIWDCDGLDISKYVNKARYFPQFHNSVGVKVQMMFMCTVLIQLLCIDISTENQLQQYSRASNKGMIWLHL